MPNKNVLFVIQNVKNSDAARNFNGKSALSRNDAVTSFPKVVAQLLVYTEKTTFICMSYEHNAGQNHNIKVANLLKVWRS
jgi:hypothetical protein